MIITLTVNPALDLYTSIDQLKANTKLRCEPIQMDPGGGGINVSRVIHRLGAETRAIYTRGGYTGNIFSELLNKEGISQDPIDIKNDLRQNFAVKETFSGNLFRFGVPGPILQESEYEAILNKISNIKDAEFFVASGSLPAEAPEDFYVQVAKEVRKNNVKFVLDTSGKALSSILTEGAYLLKPSIEELESLTGEKATDEKKQRELLLDILKNYNVKIIILSLGADGALMAADNKVKHFPAPKVEPKSSIGAGDSMVAGIIFSLSQGMPLIKATLYGIACGSATIMTHATQLLKKEDADHLYKELVSAQ
jgi:6-phosphofructokinase 2